MFKMIYCIGTKNISEKMILMARQIFGWSLSQLSYLPRSNQCCKQS